ncbi:MAG: hypothetical protein QQN63_03620 [Nitrosopumilus sp.]
MSSLASAPESGAAEWGALRPDFIHARWDLEAFCKEKNRSLVLYMPVNLCKRSPIEIMELIPRLLLVERRKIRHPLLNRDELREICKAARIPYYREMTTRVQRAVLLLWAADQGVPGDIFEV